MRLPMFPLGNVVLPGELLPLTVFEPRYRRLVLDVLAADRPEFGVVLIERGYEVGGGSGEVRTSIGTIARIARVAPLGRGRFSVIAAGLRRINVLEWLDDQPYPTGDVEDWPEPTSEPSDELTARIRELAARVEDTRKLAREVAKATKSRLPFRVTPPIKLHVDPLRAAYQVAARAPIGAADRYRLLAAPTLTARLDQLAESLGDAEAVLRFRLA